MQRINLISNQLSSVAIKKEINSKIPKNFISSAYDYLNFDEFLTPEEQKFRLKLRSYLENIKPILDNHYEKQEFPIALMKKFLSDFPGLIALGIKGFGSAEVSFWLGVAVLLEIARIDASFFTFFMIHGGKLNMNVIDKFGSEEQKNYYLPRMIKGEIISSFCLTEPDFGSDAGSIQTSVEENPKNPEELILNGSKRWIGNASLAGVLIVWVIHKKSKSIEGYLVDAKLPGVTIKKMTGKLSLRIVQNCDIQFENVIIKKSDKLPNAKNFHESVGRALLYSRLGVSWGAVGLSIGIYDSVIKYCSERKQFGKSLTSFQLIQEKIAKIMANTQAMLFFCKRMSDMYLRNKATAGNIGMLKAWCTLKGKENASLGRELLGGNGILIDHTVMKHFLDMEGLFTYEGTYDINMLVAGKEITGVTALR